MLSRWSSHYLLPVLMAIASGGVSAQTDTTQFEVRIEIESACEVAAAAPSDVDFGTVASTATNVDASGSLSVSCTPGTSYSIALDNGLNGTDVDSRAMVNGATRVPYQLYRSPARTADQVWGADPAQTYAGTGNGSIQSIPVYGRVPSTNVQAGSYTDTVTATLTY